MSKISYLKDAMSTWVLLHVLATTVATPVTGSTSVGDVLDTIEVHSPHIYLFFQSWTCCIEVAIPTDGGFMPTLDSERLWFAKPVPCAFLTEETKVKVRPLVIPFLVLAS